MIFDSIDKASMYYNLGPNIKKGLMFLESESLEDLENGRIDIDGDNVFALVQEYDTKSFDENMWEAHKKYYDIQYIVKGTEVIKLSRIEDMKPIKTYESEGDYWLFNGISEHDLKITKKQFTLLAPEDVHQPGITYAETERVKKIVVKVLI